MAQINPTLPTLGQPNASEDIDILSTLTLLVSTINNLDTANLNATAGILDAQLAQHSNGIYRTIKTVEVDFSSKTNGSTYLLSEAGSAATAGTIGVPPAGFRFTSGDYTITSKTANFRLQLNTFIGNNAPGGTIMTAGLYPITIVAGTVTLGALVTGSTAATSGLAANQVGSFNSSDFASTLLSSGYYAIGIAVTGANTPATMGIQARLQHHWS